MLNIYLKFKIFLQDYKLDNSVKPKSAALTNCRRIYRKKFLTQKTIFFSINESLTFIAYCSKCCVYLMKLSQHLYRVVFSDIFILQMNLRHGEDKHLIQLLDRCIRMQNQESSFITHALNHYVIQFISKGQIISRCFREKNVFHKHKLNNLN